MDPIIIISGAGGGFDSGDEEGFLDFGDVENDDYIFTGKAFPDYTLSSADLVWYKK